MKKYLAFALMITLSACCSSTPNFFQPIPMTVSEETYPVFDKTVLVGRVLMSAESARPQITTLGDEDYELKIDEHNRWGATPERLVQRVVNENLSHLLPNAVVENQSAVRKSYKYMVMIEILEQNGRLEERANLKASYFIKNKSGKTLKSGRFVKNLEIDGGYDTYIPAQSRLLAELSLQIAQDLALLK